MLKATLKALKASIQKWERIVEGTGVDRGIWNCPLCERYVSNQREYCTCIDGCPVYNKTGKYSCGGSPYIDWDIHINEHFDDRFERNIHCDKCKELAIKEVNFLKSLLPEGEE